MNTTTRIGKIARLPHSIREQLNFKLHDGIPAKFVLPWLNSLPQVKAILAAEFDDRPINKQNLSEWKQGGFRDWLLQHHASQFLQFLPSSSSSISSEQLETAEPLNAQKHITQPNILPLPKGEGRPALHSALDEGGGEGERDLRQPNGENQHHAHQTTNDLNHSAFHNPHSALTAKLLLWTQLQYTAMARHIDAETDPERKWNALRQFSNDISRLRRSSFADDYLQIQRDWLTLSQSTTADRKEKEFWKWTKRPDIEKKLFPNRRPGLTPEQVYELEKNCCLFEGPGPEIAELMAEVRIAKKLLELRKAQQAEARAKADPDYDPNRPLPDTKVRLAGMPFEELFPTIPEKPLTETHPELDDPDVDDSDGNGETSALPRAGSIAIAQEPQNNSPLPAAERKPEGEPTVHQPVADDSTTALPNHPGDPSDSSDSVKPSQTKSNQIKHTPPFETDETT